jgi:hypothetical protein
MVPNDSARRARLQLEFLIILGGMSRRLLVSEEKGANKEDLYLSPMKI